MKPMVAVGASVAFWAGGAAVAVGVANLFMPLSFMEVAISIFGFGLFGLFVGMTEFGPKAFRKVVATEFAHRLRPTKREAILWVLVLAVIFGVVLFDRYGRAL